MFYKIMPVLVFLASITTSYAVDCSFNPASATMLRPDPNYCAYVDSAIGVTPVALDNNGWHLLSTGGGTTYYSNNELIMAFKVPSIPVNKRISTATLNMFVVFNYTGTGETSWDAYVDFYGLGYRPASTNPLITAADHFRDATNALDTTDATLIARQVRFPWRGALYWYRTDPASSSLACYIQKQIDIGAQPGDWILIRANQGSYYTKKATDQEIRSPFYAASHPEDANGYTGPHILYNLADKPNCDNCYTAIDVDAADGQVNQNGRIDLSTSNMGNLEIGGVADNCVYVMPFKLPTLPAGSVITKAKFVAANGGYNTPTVFPVDLYGIAFRPTSAITAADYYVNYYAPRAADNPMGFTPIQPDLFKGTSNNNVGTVLSTDATASERLRCFLNQQYANGAHGGDYVFLRINHRMSYPGNFYRFTCNGPQLLYQVGSATGLTPCPSAPASIAACPLPYQASDINSDCKVSFADLAVVGQNWMKCARIYQETCW